MVASGGLRIREGAPEGGGRRFERDCVRPPDAEPCTHADYHTRQGMLAYFKRNLLQTIVEVDVQLVGLDAGFGLDLQDVIIDGRLM